MSDHTYWDELTAAFALDALEPDEMAEVTSHLRDCAHCRAELAEHTLVAAQLASVVDDEEAPAWDRIRPDAAAPVTTRTGPSAVTPLDTYRATRDRRRAPVWAAVAAGVALAVTGTVIATQQDTTQTPQQIALAACQQDSTCHVVRLQDRATLLVGADDVKVLPSRLEPAPKGSVYVLWQLPRDGRPTMVATLSKTGSGDVGERHRLALDYSKTAAFGLSLEPSGTVPTKPTKVLAVGSA